MNFKKTAIAVSSYALVGALAVAGTLAFSQDEESKMNTFTAGEAVDIVINEYQRSDGDNSPLEKFEQGKALYPIIGGAQESSGNAETNMDTYGMPKNSAAKNYVDKIVTVENTGQTDAYVRVFVAIPTALLGESIEADSDDVLHWNWGNRVKVGGGYTKEDYKLADWGWAWKNEDKTLIDPEFYATIDDQEYVVSTFYFMNVLSPEEATTAVMAGLYLDTRVDYDNGVYTMDGKVIDYDLSKGVNVPIYVDAVEATDAVALAAEDTDTETRAYVKAFAERPAQEVFWNWATKVTGSVVAAPKSGADKPAGYIPDTSGEVINSLVVVDESDDETNLRALYTKNGSITGNLTVNDSYLKGTYAMNVTAVASANAVLTVNDTDHDGWVSYSGFASASFTNCTFTGDPQVEKYGYSYARIQPYSDTTLTNCEFDEGYVLSAAKAGITITLNNCTYNGQAITADNFKSTLLCEHYGTANSYTVIIDGVTVEIIAE